jgi:NADH-quinone oxidoreductase subunit I
MFGRGLIKGLSVTMRHFVDSYWYDRNPLKWFSLKGRYDDEWLHKRQQIDGRGLFTIQYPEQKREITENFRFLPMLVYEETPEEPRCTACGICARVCPPQCIWIQRATDDRGRPKAQPANFWIDACVCMSCGFCAEFCPFDAIKMNQDHESPTADRDRDMFYDLQKLLVPVEYYAKLHPTDYAQEEAERRAKEEAKQRAAEAKAAAAAQKEAEQKKEAEAKREAAAAKAAAASEPDDLKRIEGIGPKISQVLEAAGIKTFGQLAETEVDRLKQILEEADPRLLRLANPDTWPRQAKLAAAGKWDALERWQERLRGGKEG